MARRSALARALGLVVTLPLTLLVIVFALSNRGPVAIGLWPFDDLIEMPIYLLALGALTVGFLAGAALASLGTLAARYRARREAKRAEAAERKLAEAARSPASSLPALAQSPRA